MRPLNSQVFLKPISRAATVREGSTLFLPDSARERSDEAKVVAVGPGDWAYGHRMPIDLEKDDRVLFLRRGYTATINGEKLLVVTDRDIIAVLEDDESAVFIGESIDAEARLEDLGRE